jgi:hypothetical protein
MRKTFLVLSPVMAFAIVLLVLNVRERDYYEFGTEKPPAKGNTVTAEDAAFARIFPELKFTHACSGCGECVHPFEVVENRRVMSIHDHDGWYKLFWAADEEYYYDDPIHLLADYHQNRTAETPRGTWTIMVRAGSATHRSAPAHECGQLPRELRLSYELVMSEDPLDTAAHSGDGPLKVPQTFPWLVTNPGTRFVSLGWRLMGAPAVQAGPCPCARP